MSVLLVDVTEDEADIRLDRWLRRRYPHITQGLIQKLCRTGQIRVQSRRADPSARLSPGQTVRIPPAIVNALAPQEVPRPAIDEKDRRDINKMVLYRDEHLIVLNKPAGLAVQGGPGITRHIDGMLDGLKESESEPRPRLVHRIDRDTSGLLLIARTPGVAARLAASFRGRDVKKTYWAVVVGRPHPLSGVIDLPLAKVGIGAGAISVPAQRKDEDAVHALTDYQVIDSAARKLSWLELSPLTGRMHQLRVHCDALGTPILGDPKYGGDKASLDGFASQLHLHARALDIAHPAGGRLIVAAEMPAHMRATFRQLGFTPPMTEPPRRS